MHSSTLFIDGHKARVKYDPIIEMFRGEFLNTDRRATFIAGDAKELTIAARDAYAARGGWLSERQAAAITYHDEFGEVARTIITPEMLQKGSAE